ncbi:Crp/Fnr family transcriptional regulator [Sphingomonas sp. PAMC 26617]|uniref:Crp/Fnr family transcriptional regulator n=1 Tax=Sphingomonas sp. PAMC 26617 TaxID=1112216 RepID=UPI0009D94EE9|nr:Crp/Fnr family transcriptional regulator [Sphingomonas sp. PAMC 26617]
MNEAPQPQSSLSLSLPPYRLPTLSGTALWRSPFLSQQERRALEDAVASPRPVSVHKQLVREGACADSLFLIIEGWACRYTTTTNGSRQFSALLLPGDLCNLDALLTVRPDYGVRTLTQATILALPRDRALALATQHAGITRTFTWLAFVENAILGKWAQSLGRRSAKERLAHLLCELSMRSSMADGTETSFEFPLTQEQIADALGLTAVHVNRMMHLLRAEGLVAIANRTMTLPDVARLRQIGGFDPRYLHIKRSEVEATTGVAAPQSSALRNASFSHSGE